MRCTKTEAGQQAFKQRSPDLSARQRSAFLLFDGQRSVTEVLKATEGLGVVLADVEDLLAKGYLEGPASPASPAPTPAQAVDASSNAGEHPITEQQFMNAYALATQLTAGLGLRGFRLNLAVEAASGYTDLVALLPKLTDALGAEAVRPLKKALGKS
jgi:hypothetical protein